MLREEGDDLPPSEETSTGHELANYVRRLTQLAPLQERIHENCEVVSVTRDRLLKSDFFEDERRANASFRLLLRERDGREHLHLADAVIDATGVYHSHNPMGSGGAFCPGEAGLRNKIDYALPDVLGCDLERFANRHTLVIGSGHSSATTLLAVSDLFERFPETRLTWVVRRDVAQDGNPYALDERDSSPHRQELHRRANVLAHDKRVTFLPRTVVDAVRHDGEAFEVVLKKSESRSLVIRPHNIAAHTGFRADASLWSDLQIPLHPATGGPASLSNVLMAENRRLGTGLSTGYAEKRPDCADKPPLETDADPAQPRLDPRVADPELLRLPEPNFFVLGIKSYGRDAGFLMHNGFRQVRDAYKILSGNAELNLYGSELE
jgi:thioredoxin reductase